MITINPFLILLFYNDGGGTTAANDAPLANVPQDDEFDLSKEARAAARPRWHFVIHDPTLDV